MSQFMAYPLLNETKADQKLLDRESQLKMPVHMTSISLPAQQTEKINKLGVSHKMTLKYGS
jgi:hypothetical protein